MLEFGDDVDVLAARSGRNPGVGDDQVRRPEARNEVSCCGGQGRLIRHIGQIMGGLALKGMIPGPAGNQTQKWNLRGVTARLHSADARGGAGNDDPHYVAWWTLSQRESPLCTIPAR